MNPVPPSLDAPRRRWSPLRSPALSFVAILLFCRVLFLLAALDPAEERVMTILDPVRAHAPTRPERPLYDLEELYAGSAAEAIRMGAGLPLACYRVAPYGSGSLLVPLAAVPLYAALGPYYLVFKILPLLVTVLGGLAWFLVVRAWRGGSVASVFAGLYIFAPSMFVRTALIAKGDHAEAMAWIGGVLLLMTWAAKASTPERKRLFAASAGVAAGLGPFITYSTIPVPAAVIAVILIRTRARPRDAWLLALAGFLVGLIPWLVSIVSTHGAILRVYDRPIGSLLPLPAMLARGRILLSRGLLAGYDLPGGDWVRNAAAFLWLGAVALGAGIAFRRDRSTATLAGLGAGLAGLAVYCAASPDASSRYLLPVYPLLLAILAAIWRPPDQAFAGARGPIRFPSRVPVICVMLVGLLSQTWTITQSRYPALHAPLKGTHWQIFGEYVGQLAGADRIMKAPRSLQRFLWIGCGKRTYWQVERDDWPAVAALAGPDSSRFWEGIGIAWVESGRAGEAGDALARLPDRERNAIRFGMSRRMEIPFSQMAIGAPDLLPRFLHQFRAADQPGVSAMLPYILATLTAQEVLPATTADKLATSVLDTDGLARGRGWIAYRGIDRRGSAPFSPSPPGRWTAVPSPRLRDCPVSFIEGWAHAWEWDLSRRDAGWVLRDGRSGGPGAYQDLAQMTAGLDSAQARPFYRAVGRAMAAAEHEPGRRRGGEVRAPELGGFPERYRTDVLSGWTESDVPWASR